MAKASRRSQVHLIGRPTRLAAQATSANSGTSAVADAEIPADIPRDDADRGRRHAEDGGDIVALTHHAAAGAGMNGVLRCIIVVAADRRAQLHRHAGDAVDRRFEPDDMRRPRESEVGRGYVAGFGIDAQIGAVLLPDDWRPQCQRIARPRDRRQRLVDDGDLLGRIHRLRERLGDDRRNGFADMADLVDRQTPAAAR